MVLEEVVSESKVPILIIFYANWCGACMRMKPVIERLEMKLQDKVKIVKLDIEENQELSRKFAIPNLPVFLLYKNKQKIREKFGVLLEQELLDLININR